jgi:hypothetical protein
MGSALRLSAMFGYGALMCLTRCILVLGLNQKSYCFSIVYARSDASVLPLAQPLLGVFLAG